MSPQVGRFLEAPDVDTRVELGKKVGKAAEEFVSTCANVASMISDSQLASAVIAKYVPDKHSNDFVISSN